MLTQRPVKFLPRAKRNLLCTGAATHAPAFSLGLPTAPHRGGRQESDGGAYSSFGLVTTYYSGQLLTLPGRQVIPFSSTATTPTSRLAGQRGHGSVQPRFAFEVMLDAWLNARL